MIDRETDKKAKALYDACTTVKPSWEQLSDITRDVWRERVLAQTVKRIRRVRPVEVK